MSASTDSLTTDVVVNDQIVHLRPISGDDIDQERLFLETISAEGRYSTLLGDTADIDYDNKMAFIAVTKGANGKEEVIGVGRYATDEFDHCETVIRVAEDWYAPGLGQVLMNSLIDFARNKGKEFIYAVESTDNSPMLVIARDVGMDPQRDPENAGLIRYELTLP